MDTNFISQNNGFQIEVKTDFDFENSNPLQYHYLFRYTVVITNLTGPKAQLLSRKWNIKDAKGEVRIVEGPGVIGQTPDFEVGESFEYSSFCPLSTLTGEMWGHFNMTDEDGEDFKIETPHFKFKIPDDYIDRY
jgi:ApaG protein